MSNLRETATFNIKALNKAATNLKAGPFKLWMYFAKKSDGTIFDFSFEDVEEDFGMKESQYKEAMKVLKQEGYLVKIEHTRSSFYFYEDPQMKDAKN